MIIAKRKNFNSVPFNGSGLCSHSNKTLMMKLCQAKAVMFI